MFLLQNLYFLFLRLMHIEKIHLPLLQLTQASGGSLFWGVLPGKTALPAALWSFEGHKWNEEVLDMVKKRIANHSLHRTAWSAACKLGR